MGVLEQTKPVDLPVVPAEKPSKNLLCPICKELIQIPTSTPCGHTFCQKCIEMHANVNGCCPTCVEKVETSMLKPNGILADHLAVVKIHCKNGCKKAKDGSWEHDPQGCPEIIESGERHLHENTCIFQDGGFCLMENNQEEAIEETLEEETPVTSLTLSSSSSSCANMNHSQLMEEINSLEDPEEAIRLLKEEIASLQAKVQRYEQEGDFKESLRLGSISIKHGVIETVCRLREELKGLQEAFFRDLDASSQVAKQKVQETSQKMRQTQVEVQQKAEEAGQKISEKVRSAHETLKEVNWEEQFQQFMASAGFFADEIKQKIQYWSLPMEERALIDQAIKASMDSYLEEQEKILQNLDKEENLEANTTNTTPQ